MGIPFALSLATPHPSPSLGISSAGQLLGVGRGPGQRASVTGLPPARAHWAGSHPAVGHGVVVGESNVPGPPALAGTRQERAHLLPAGTWEDQAEWETEAQNILAIGSQNAGSLPAITWPLSL